MSKISVVYVGIDVHKDTNSVCVFSFEENRIYSEAQIDAGAENLDRYLSIVDSPSNTLCLCTGSLGCAKFNDIPAMVRKYSAAGRIGFMHIRNVKIMEDGSFEERAHLSSCGSLDMYGDRKGPGGHRL